MSKQLLNLCLAALLSVVSTAAWALDKVDGVYQISTAEDLKAFAELVNGSEPTANAVLTADIDKGTETYRIGRDGQDYQGVFDGAGHTITYNMSFIGENGAGLFRNVGVHALIKNLKVQGTLASNGSYAGGLAGWCSGRISGCYVNVDIVSSKSGDATDGGIVGMGYRGTVIENCLAKITIQGETTTNCAGVCGWATEKINIANCLVVSDGSTLNISNGSSANICRNGGNLNTVNLSTYNSNPYANRPAGANYNNYVTQQWGNNNATTVVPLANLADGKICYQLNNDQSRINWVQKIGTDPFPVPVAFGSTEDQVFASGPTGCNGKADGLTYANSGTVQATAHTFDKYGICTTCGCFNFGGLELDVADNAVLLKSADDIFLAEGWNRIGDGFKLDMKMANDIEITAPSGQLIFNNGNWVDGNFNGDGHSLTIGIADVGNEASFMPQHTGIFENVIMHGTISTTGQYAGCISGRARQTIVRNVFSDVTINTSKTGDNTSGGFFGITYNEDGKSAKVVENCIYAGAINGVEGTQCIAGFAGWADKQTNYKNCAFLGVLNNAGGDSHTISRNNGNITCDNVYYVNQYTNADKAIQVASTAVESGELAYLLNGSQNGLGRFYQKIGEDLMPTPIAKEGALVYCVSAEYRCDGTPIGSEVTYSNSATGVNIPDHTPVDGICTTCGNPMEDYMTPVDGWYEISNGKQLTWWCNYVNKNAEAKARLTADINMEGCMTRFVPAGTVANKFVTEFDGQGHVISNFTYSGGDYSGLFGVIGGGSVIKNFVLDNTCSISGNAFCSVIGGTNGGGDVYITNVGNEGTVTGTAQNVCGIIGVDMDGSATLHISNCFVTGTIKGARESATICGWSNNSSVVENCYSIALLEGVSGTNSFTRGQTSVSNSYELDGVGTQDGTTKVTAEQVANGALCFKLNDQQDALARFYQKIDTDAHPRSIAQEGALVYSVYASYRCDGVPTGELTGYANAPADVASSHVFTDGVCDICSTIETDADGYAKIINAKCVKALATRVNEAGDTGIKARMYADIDMTGVTTTPIGTLDKKFIGEYDGQGHVFSNLSISGGDYTGLFGVISGGAVIKNFVLDKTCSISGNAFVGAIGGTNGSGDVYISCIGNEGNVTGTAQNVCGILGTDWYGEATLHISDCYVTGTIKGARESATICGWSSASSRIENCYSIASLEGIYETGSFTRGQGYVSNSYEIEGVGVQVGVAKVTAQDVANGILCYKLNSPAFGQLIGTDAHPVFGGPEVSYVGDAGYATLYDAKAGYELNGDVKAYVAVLNSTWLDLNEIPNIPAGTPVVLKGGYYNKLAADLPAINVANDLKGTNSATTADGTMYILAKVGDQVGFYKAEGTIPAGKAYYQSESGVKAFFFGGDDATGISEVESSKMKVESPIYNLAGQRLQKMQKGINIINGKKVLK